MTYNALSKTSAAGANGFIDFTTAHAGGFVAGAVPRKVVYVPGKLLNLVI